MLGQSRAHRRRGIRSPEALWFRAMGERSIVHAPKPLSRTGFRLTLWLNLRPAPSSRCRLPAELAVRDRLPLTTAPPLARSRDDVTASPQTHVSGACVRAAMIDGERDDVAREDRALSIGSDRRGVGRHETPGSSRRSGLPTRRGRGPRWLSVNSTIGGATALTACPRRHPASSRRDRTPVHDPSDRGGGSEHSDSARMSTSCSWRMTRSVRAERPAASQTSAKPVPSTRSQLTRGVDAVRTRRSWTWPAGASSPSPRQPRKPSPGSWLRPQ
jgi:hypothetical protein